MSAANLEVPDEFNDWPHDARRFVLAEANSMEDLRKEMNALAGIPSEGKDLDGSSITKDEVAALVIALGGPQEGAT